MKLLEVHSHYLQKGGEDTAFENECAMLANAGHTVVRKEFSNTDLPKNPLKLLLQTVWNGSARREMLHALEAERPDAVLCHNTFPLLSPSIYWACAEAKIPVIQTLHNYRLACLNGYLFRDGEICKKCLGRSPLRGVCKKCYRDSLGASAAVALMLVFHRLIGTFRRKVTRFIALTDAGRDIFIKAGLPADKIAVKPNFIQDNSLAIDTPARLDGKRVFLYAGRLSPEKGPHILLQAWRLMPEGFGTLRIAGDGPERAALEEMAKNCASPVKFLGMIPPEKLHEEMQGATALAFPSICFEGCPMAPFEAQAVGTPVIISGCVSVSRTIRPGRNGEVFAAGDPAALAATLRRFAAAPYRVQDNLEARYAEAGNCALLEAIIVEAAESVRSSSP